MTTPQEILATPMQANDAEAATIGEYLAALLLGVWHEGEGFDGKRPFGNSSWECEIHVALVSAGLIAGTLDEDGYLDDFGGGAEADAQALIDSAIRTLSTPQSDDGTTPPVAGASNSSADVSATGAATPEAPSSAARDGWRAGFLQGDLGCRQRLYSKVLLAAIEADAEDAVTGRGFPS